MPRTDKQPAAPATDAQDVARDIVDTIFGEVVEAGDLLDLEDDELAEFATKLYPMVRAKLPARAAPVVAPSDETQRALTWLEQALRKGTVSLAHVEQRGDMYELGLEVGDVQASGCADSVFGAIVRCQADLRKQLKASISDAQSLVE